MRGEILRERWQDARAALEQDDASGRSIDAAKVASQTVAGDRRQHPRQFYACRPAADDHERQVRRTIGFIRCLLRFLESGKKATPDLDRIVDIL